MSTGKLIIIALTVVVVAYFAWRASKHETQI